MTKLETIAAKIKATTNLHDLLRALVEFETEMKKDEGYKDWSTETLLQYNGVDLHAIPTFGGTKPRDTDGVWSWDEYRILVGDNPAKFTSWEIFDRDDESQAWRA